MDTAAIKATLNHIIALVDEIKREERHKITSVSYAGLCGINMDCRDLLAEIEQEQRKNG